MNFNLWMALFKLQQAIFNKNTVPGLLLIGIQAGKGQYLHIKNYTTER